MPTIRELIERVPHKLDDRFVAHGVRYVRYVHIKSNMCAPDCPRCALDAKMEELDPRIGELPMGGGERSENDPYVDDLREQWARLYCKAVFTHDHDHIPSRYTTIPTAAFDEFDHWLQNRFGMGWSFQPVQPVELSAQEISNALIENQTSEEIANALNTLLREKRK